MNRPSPLLILPVMMLVLASTSCTTVENYKALYFPQTVWGPYTRLLHHRYVVQTTSEQTTVTSSSDGKNVIKPQN